MLYVGYPMSYESANELFKAKDDEDLIDLIKKSGLGFYHTDKGQNVLGLDLEEFYCSCDTFVKVDDGLMKILACKKKVKDLLKAASLDITSVALRRFYYDEVPEFIDDPEPYLIIG